MGQNPVGILTVQLVLGSTGQIDVGLLLPRSLVLEELSTIELVSVWLADIIAGGTQLQQVVNLLGIQAGGIVDIAVRATDGDNLSTQLSSFLGGTSCHVTET